MCKLILITGLVLLNTICFGQKIEDFSEKIKINGKDAISHTTIISHSNFKIKIVSNFIAEEVRLSYGPQFDQILLSQEFIFIKDGIEIKRFYSPAFSVNYINKDNKTYTILENNISFLDFVSVKNKPYYALYGSGGCNGPSCSSLRMLVDFEGDIKILTYELEDQSFYKKNVAVGFSEKDMDGLMSSHEFYLRKE